MWGMKPEIIIGALSAIPKTMENNVPCIVGESQVSKSQEVGPAPNCSHFEEADIIGLHVHVSTYQ